jgi:hypothetical protein
MPQLDRNTITQLLSPGQRLVFAWRTAADEVWSTWAEVKQAPRPTRPGAFGQQLHTLDMEHRAANALAAHHRGHASDTRADEPDLAA